MKTAKNDPGLKVGDKIRHRCTWIDENDKLVTGNYGENFTITKVNSRSFYTERKEGTAKFSTSDGWDYISFQKEEDDVWMATASLGKIPQSEKQS